LGCQRGESLSLASIGRGAAFYREGFAGGVPHGLDHFTLHQPWLPGGAECKTHNGTGLQHLLVVSYDICNLYPVSFKLEVAPRALHPSCQCTSTSEQCCQRPRHVSHSWYNSTLGGTLRSACVTAATLTFAAKLLVVQVERASHPSSYRKEWDPQQVARQHNLLHCCCAAALLSNCMLRSLDQPCSSLTCSAWLARCQDLSHVLPAAAASP
jgi:hypothetical protein